MILPNLVVPSRANQHWRESGIDSFEKCHNRDYFSLYPYTVEYQYTSRGFRDIEWPDDLAKSIWCIGDSFTVGVGSPYLHIWPQIVENKLSTRTINISMDGASNNWISRTAVEVINKVSPKNIIILWSYVERYEPSVEETMSIQWNNFYNAVKDPVWPQCNDYRNFQNLPLAIRKELKNHYCGDYICINDELSDIVVTKSFDEGRAKTSKLRLTDSEDLDNFKKCMTSLSQLKTKTNIIQAFVPDFSKDQLKNKYISICDPNCIGEVLRLDIARDGHHFDIKTSQWLAEKVIPLLK